MRKTVKQILKLIGPIILSALSIFISFKILQPLANFLDPTFNLLSSRGIGKIAFTLLVIFQIILLLITLPRSFFARFLKTNLYFLFQKNWLLTFFGFFSVCFFLHTLVLFSFFLIGFATYNPNWGTFNINLMLRILFGFIATFFLAWTEELIFRGTLFPYFSDYLNRLSSLFLTSLIFMLVHDLLSPLNLITKNWDLGLGLFLLGMMLNLIFIDTGKLYAGMGAHAGLVFVKVVMRQAPLITFLPTTKLPFWVSKDLRTSNFVHLLFLIVIIFFAIKNRKKLLPGKN